MKVSSKKDEWGNDPTIQRVRRLFGLFESQYNDLLKQIGLSPMDARLRHVREATLALYGKACDAAAARRQSWYEGTSAVIYTGCLLLVLSKSGIQIPDAVLKAHESHSQLLREVLA